MKPDEIELGLHILAKHVADETCRVLPCSCRTTCSCHIAESCEM